MFKVYSFLLYYIYRSVKKSGSSTSVSSAAMLFAANQSLNLLVLFIIIGLLINFDIIAAIGKLYFVTGFILLMILNMIIANNKRIFEEIIDRFKGKEEHIHKKNWIITLSYMILSFLLVFIVSVIKKLLSS